MYIYEKTDENLWTVGFYRPDGSFAGENDYNTEKKAADRVHYLNGGKIEDDGPELIRPMDQFKSYLEEHTDYSWIDFGNGLLVVFTDDNVNIRQYYDEACLSSWVDKEEFHHALNDLQKKSKKRPIKLDREALDHVCVGEPPF